MDSRALANIIVRLSGLIIVVYAVTNSAKTIAQIFDLPFSQGIPYSDLALSTLFSLSIPLIVGLFLIYFPATIARKALRIEGTDIDSNSASLLQHVAFSSIGLWLVVFSIIDASYFFGKTRLYLRYYQDYSATVPMPPMHPDDFGGMVSCGVQLVLGLLLLIGSRGLVKLGENVRGHQA